MCSMYFMCTMCVPVRCVVFEYIGICNHDVFLCEVCYFDMCEYIEYMKYVGSMIEWLNDLYLNHQIQHCTQQMTRSSHTKE